jgi:IS4 transposase
MPRSQGSTATISAASTTQSSSTKCRRRSLGRVGTASNSKPAGTVRRILREQESKRIKNAYGHLESTVFRLFTREEVEEEARKSGFCQRVPQQIPPFEFVLCCALCALLEAKRGFAGLWRMLGAAAGIVVARSAVTQRFGKGSATLMERLFERALERLPRPEHPELLGKLRQFKQVLAQDGTVLQLSPLLKKLFPATRTNCVSASAKVHATADVVHRRIVSVVVTGERVSELGVAKELGIRPGTLYIRDLGYTCYDEFASMIAEDADLLMRLKSNANPKVLRVRHGVIGPRRSEGQRFKDLCFSRASGTFDLDARFRVFDGATVDARVVGTYDKATGEWHCYVTTLPVEFWSVEELVKLYSLRWVIELFFKFLKSTCHLDHLDTKNPEALRTQIYASLLSAIVLSAVVLAATQATGIPASSISLLTVGNAAPLLVVPLMLLWCRRKLSHEELSAAILRVVALGCRDQNPRRTTKKWAALR